jgi:hypothetical protein
MESLSLRCQCPLAYNLERNLTIETIFKVAKRSNNNGPESTVSPTQQSLVLLEQWEITSYVLLPRGSNYTFMATLEGPDGATVRAIYKPGKGERRLWDFPYGSLGARERASFLLAEALGWHFVPPTVVREGPEGLGSVQLFVEHDPQQHYFTLKELYPDEFERMCLFDWLANNADRKAGHCLLSADGTVWGIDHGLTFHEQHKLRTVIWDFAGAPVPEGLLKDIEALGPKLERLEGPLAELAELIEPSELAALKQRREVILERRQFLTRYEGGVPWPLL